MVQLTAEHTGVPGLIKLFVINPMSGGGTSQPSDFTVIEKARVVPQEAIKNKPIDATLNAMLLLPK
jgi:hypothetical protein